MRRPVRALPLVVVASVVALALLGIFIRSFSAAESGGRASAVFEIVAFVLGVWVPLFALIYACVRNRVAVVALAFCVGLSVNVVFLTHAMPAAAVTDNSNVFTLMNAAAYNAPMVDMAQSYTPSASTATKCPSSGNAYNWTCRFASDQFSAGQTFTSGTATADLYLENQSPPPTTNYSTDYSFTSAAAVSSITLTQIAGVQSGEVIIAHISIRGGTGNGTITKPSASWNLVDRIDSGTSVTLAVYSLVTGASEPGSYTWSWSSGAQKAVAIMRAYSGVDTTAPVDGHAGSTESSASTTHVAPSVNATYANEMRIVAVADSSSTGCNPIIGWQMQSGGSSGGGGASTDVNSTTYYSNTFLGAGPTGTFTATPCGNDIAATHQLTLKPVQTVQTCTVTARLKLITAVVRRSTSTGVLNSGLSLSLNAPAGAVAGDVLVASVGKTGSESFTTPSGWTRVNFVTDSSTMMFAAYYHVVANGDPASYGFTWTGATNRYAAGGISAYSNVDNDNPIDAQASAGVNNTTSYPAPTVTTTFAGDMLVTVHGVNSNSTWTPPAGMSEIFDQVAGASTTFVAVEQNELLLGGPGATGAKTATSSATGGGGGVTLTLKAGLTLGSGTADVTSPTNATLSTATFSMSAVTFAAGDRLELDVITPNDSANCQVRMSYDSTTTQSRLTVATVVPESVAGLLLLAPALPVGLRSWKRRRP